jgi:two-component sensor histidine kinase
LGNSDRVDLDAAEFLSKLCDDLEELHKGLRPIGVRIHTGNVPLTPHRAMIAGIMLNESVTNAFKYAFPDNRPGEIDVSFDFVDPSDPQTICLSVTDNGVGPSGEKNPHSTGMGQRIMHAMSSQLNGTYALTREGDKTISRVCFPVKKVDPRNARR